MEEGWRGGDSKRTGGGEGLVRRRGGEGGEGMGRRTGKVWLGEEGMEKEGILCGLTVYHSGPIRPLYAWRGGGRVTLTNIY